VAWEDCRFRAKCSSNDIVFSTSSDGVTWSPVTRVPIDLVTSGADHFIPGLAVDSSTSGSTTHLALTYYYYPDATCNGGCQLDIGFISSTDGGAHWSLPTQLAGPTPLFEIANTSQGRMVGDYISTSFSGGLAATLLAVGLPQTAGTFDEGMWAPTTPLTATGGTQPATPGRVLSTGGTGQGALLQSTRKG
jgi:hypothetical protein